MNAKRKGRGTGTMSVYAKRKGRGTGTMSVYVLKKDLIHEIKVSFMYILQLEAMCKDQSCMIWLGSPKMYS